MSGRGTALHARHRALARVALTSVGLAGLIALPEPAQATIRIQAGPCVVLVAAVGGGNMGPRNDAQGRADEQRVADALIAALADSADMRQKYEEACQQRNDEMHILVWRDNPNLYVAAANVEVPNWAQLHVDLADLESMGDFLSGPDAAQMVVNDSFLTRSLAHEIDHLRDPPVTPDDENPARQHTDPPGRDGLTEKGPAVEDANTVLGDLGIMVERRSYIAVRDGRVGTRLAVTTSGAEGTVFWAVQDHQEATLQQQTENNGSDLIRIPASLGKLPYMRCPGLHCFPPATASDGDLDGQADKTDNCPSKFNPQQGDDDGDAVGNVCAPG